MKRIITTAILATLASSAAFAAVVTQSAPNTFVSGEAAVAAQVNDNFAQVYANSYQNAQTLGLTATNVQVVSSSDTLANALRSGAGTPAEPNVIVLAPGSYTYTGIVPSHVQLVNPSVGTVTLTGNLILGQGDMLRNLQVINVSSGSPALSVDGALTLRDVTITQNNAAPVIKSNTANAALIKLDNVTVNANNAALYDNNQNTAMVLLALNSELNVNGVANVKLINSYQYNEATHLTVLPNQ
jgi:hypothetical protein